MPTHKTSLACACSASAGLLATVLFLNPARATQEQVTHMQTLEEWKLSGIGHARRAPGIQRRRQS